MIPQSRIQVGKVSLPVYSLNTLVVGSGAAGLNCADHLARYMEQSGLPDACDRVAVVTDRLGAGTSHNSGSDKQTYYRLGVCGDTSDTPLDLARTLADGGCMHGDIALCEAENSAREFYHLVENGVPFPHDGRGMFVGYKTDHDPRQRATSAGPWTSRYMVRCATEQLKRYGVTIFEKHELVALLTVPYDGSGIDAQENISCRCVGALTVDRSAAGGPGYGLTVWNCQNVVVATGGPGAMYKVSVYPQGQMGSHGLLFETGCVAHNLTESQFGLASIRPRWNVSGTYQQVIPNYFSTDASGGDKQFFMNRYFARELGSPEEAMRQLASSIFLKGYQWPFDPDRCVKFGSSLVDLAVHSEVAEGRRVFMDFLNNPVAEEGLAEFRLDNLGSEAAQYLERSRALQARPIDRLAHMNQPSIDLYAELGLDITAEPLEVAVCNQHCNGGFKVNRWWETNVHRLFCVGELAGTHGVKRPGGSALNATQVGGLRAAQYIAHRLADDPASADAFVAGAKQQIRATIDRAKRLLTLGESAGKTLEQVENEIGQRMSEKGGFLRSDRGLDEGINQAEQLYRELREHGVKLGKQEQWPSALRAEHMCLTHWGFLVAMRERIGRGGGSRGSHLILDPMGTPIHSLLPQWRFRPEDRVLRGVVLEVRWGEDERFHFSVRSVRPIPHSDAWFENTWSAYRSGAIYQD